MISKLRLYIVTLCYLKLSQIFFRIFRLFPKKLSSLPIIPTIRELNSPLPICLPKPISITGSKEFFFLNRKVSLPPSFDWGKIGDSALWRYNLHYFDDLLAPAELKRKAWQDEYFDLWINSQPFGSPISWDPYPLSQRIVNWVKSHHFREPLSTKAIESLANQAHWLERHFEWHLMGNHLFVNAKALIWAGCFFEGPMATKWLRKGLKILNQQLDEQILKDGGHFELSPMYHALILEDILDLIALCDGYKVSPLSQLRSKLSMCALKMLRWLQIMSHPDGEISFFNDAAFGVCQNYSSLKVYAERLGLKSKDRLERTAILTLSESGYYRINKGPFTILSDIAQVGASYIPGHGHADCLSFELSIEGYRVMVNGGTSVYGTTPQRLKERGTAAHNTVIVGEQNSSEVWSSFRVARRAYPSDIKITETPSKICLSASHDGYKRLKNGPIHKRTWTCTEQKFIIEDIAKSERYKTEARFTLHPQIELQQKSHSDFVIKLPNNRTCNLKFSNALVEDSEFAPEFGLRLPTKALVVPLKSGYSSVEIQINAGR